MFLSNGSRLLPFDTSRLRETHELVTRPPASAGSGSSGADRAVLQRFQLGEQAKGLTLLACRMGLQACSPRSQACSTGTEACSPGTHACISGLQTKNPGSSATIPTASGCPPLRFRESRDKSNASKSRHQWRAIWSQPRTCCTCEVVDCRTRSTGQPLMAGLTEDESITPRNPCPARSPAPA
jgi:hypothetical protein